MTTNKVRVGGCCGGGGVLFNEMLFTFWVLPQTLFFCTTEDKWQRVYQTRPWQQTQQSNNNKRMQSFQKLNNLSMHAPLQLPTAIIDVISPSLQYHHHYAFWQLEHMLFLRGCCFSFHKMWNDVVLVIVATNQQTIRHPSFLFSPSIVVVKEHTSFKHILKLSSKTIIVNNTWPSPSQF